MPPQATFGKFVLRGSLIRDKRGCYTIVDFCLFNVLLQSVHPLHGLQACAALHAEHEDTVGLGYGQTVPLLEVRQGRVAVGQTRRGERV